MAEKSYFGESKSVEFKREIPQRHEKFLKDIIAFANCSGGKVILGIEDGSDAVCGIGQVNPFRLSDDITNMIADACTPQIETDITAQTLEGKTVLVIDVAPGRFRPYHLKAQGKESSAYIRINGTSRAADARRLQELELEGQRIYYDTLQEIGMEYDEDAAQSLCEKMREVALSACRTEEERSEVPEMTISKLEDMGLLCKLGRDYAPTHAFNLMTVNKVRYAKIQCALFKGVNRDIFIDRREYKGPIYEQIEEAYQFVKRHINLSAEINGIVRRDYYELPILAVREAIVNGVTHRSYLDDSCMQVSIYDDRVEIYSPGMLYGGLDITEALQGKSKCRNAAISEAFHYMKIIEAWGTGLSRIRSSCREYGLREPTIEEAGDGFCVVFYRQIKSEVKGAGSETENVDSETEKVGSETENVGSEIEKAGSETENVGSGAEKAGSAFEKYREKLHEAGITKTYVLSVEIVYNCVGGAVFGQSNVMKYLGCSKAKAAKVMSAMRKAKIIEAIEGAGFGKYHFSEAEVQST